MKSLMETYTPLIKSLQDLNQEIRLRLSSMPYYTEQEMLSLEQWLEEVRVLEGTLENVGDILPPHARNRMTIINMRKSTNEEWLEWGIENGIHESILQWARS